METGGGGVEKLGVGVERLEDFRVEEWEWEFCGWWVR